MKPKISANLDYLPAGSSLLDNLQPDADGIITVPLADLGAGQQIHVMVIDGHQAVYDSTVRAEQLLKPRSRALSKSLSSDQHLTESKRIEFVTAGETASLDNAHAADVQVYDSIGSIYRLFTTITNDSDLQKFAFMLDWPTMTRAKLGAGGGGYAAYVESAQAAKEWRLGEPKGRGIGGLRAGAQAAARQSPRVLPEERRRRCPRKRRRRTQRAAALEQRLYGVGGAT